MSSVFLAADPDGRQVALKLLNLSLESEPEFRKRFQREAELTQKLEHPNIVKTFHWEDDPDVGVYLIMEYIPGGNLRQKLDDPESQPWTLEQTLKLFAPVAEAIDYAHSQGVVHRDLKPENLLFLDSQTLKIADFGVARVDQGSRLTRTGVLPGTPEYMAPEQFSEQPSGPAADFYSLATILYEVLVGTTPFRSDNLALVLQKQAFEQPPPPSQQRPDLPAYLDRVLLKALDKKADRRYPSARDLIQALATRPSGSLSGRAVGSGSLSELPTRQVNWRQELEVPRRSLPWLLLWAVWTAAALAGLWRLYPAPERPSWLSTPLGWQPAPVGRQLCWSVVWNGLEVALVAPDQQQTALDLARFASGQWGDWLLQDKLGNLKGELVGEVYVLSVAGQDWLRVDAQMAANLKARPAQIGEYWLALLQDVNRLRQGKAPFEVRELERRRPLRLDGTPPRYLLLETLYERCRIRQREGAFPPEVILESLDSLGSPETRRLREAARSIPLPKPTS